MTGDRTSQYRGRFSPLGLLVLASKRPQARHRSPHLNSVADNRLGPRRPHHRLSIVGNRLDQLSQHVTGLGKLAVAQQVLARHPKDLRAGTTGLGQSTEEVTHQVCCNRHVRGQFLQSHDLFDLVDLRIEGQLRHPGHGRLVPFQPREALQPHGLVTGPVCRQRGLQQKTVTGQHLRAPETCRTSYGRHVLLGRRRPQTGNLLCDELVEKFSTPLAVDKLRQCESAGKCLAMIHDQGRLELGHRRGLSMCRGHHQGIQGHPGRPGTSGMCVEIRPGRDQVLVDPTRRHGRRGIRNRFNRTNRIPATGTAQ